MGEKRLTMSEKQTKKLKSLAALFYQSQPPNTPTKKSLIEIYQQLKQVHKQKQYAKKAS